MFLVIITSSFSSKVLLYLQQMWGSLQLHQNVLVPQLELILRCRGAAAVGLIHFRETYWAHSVRRVLENVPGFLGILACKAINEKWKCTCASSLTSLQSVLGDRAAVNTQADSCEGSHLDLVLSPDDEVFQQTVVSLWAADILLLVVPWQPCQTVPAHRHRLSCKCVVTSEKSKYGNCYEIKYSEDMNVFKLLQTVFLFAIWILGRFFYSPFVVTKYDNN